MNSPRTGARHGVVSISGGDHRARILRKRDALIAANLDLVPPIAGRILQTLPPSFDLDDLIQSGRIGLMEAALVYRPHEHDETPFPVFARARIRGAILDSVRRGKYLDATLQPIDGIAEESETPNMEVLIDQLRTRKRIDRIAFETLSVEQAAVIDAYYSPESPSLATVALTLDLPEWRVYRAHAQALAILRRHLDAA